MRSFARVRTVGRMPTNTKSKWRLRTKKFDAIARSVFGVTTDRAVAERLGFTTDTLSEIRTGTRSPSSNFMAACKREMPTVQVEDLFELDEDC